MTGHSTAPIDRARIAEIRERAAFGAEYACFLLRDLCDALLADGKAEDNTRPVSSGLEDSADVHGVAVPLPSNPVDAALLIAEAKEAVAAITPQTRDAIEHAERVQAAQRTANFGFGAGTYAADDHAAEVRAEFSAMLGTTQALNALLVLQTLARLVPQLAARLDAAGKAKTDLTPPPISSARLREIARGENVRSRGAAMESALHTMADWLAHQEGTGR